MQLFGFSHSIMSCFFLTTSSAVIFGRYYYQGCASWGWYFPYHYAPFASDFRNCGKVKVSIFICFMLFIIIRSVPENVYWKLYEVRSFRSDSGPQHFCRGMINNCCLSVPSSALLCSYSCNILILCLIFYSYLYTFTLNCQAIHVEFYPLWTKFFFSSFFGT